MKMEEDSADQGSVHSEDHLLHNAGQDMEKKSGPEEKSGKESGTMDKSGGGQENVAGEKIGANEESDIAPKGGSEMEDNAEGMMKSLC